MPERLTNEEAALLKALFDRATGLSLQLPSTPDANAWIAEFSAAVSGPYQAMIGHVDHERVKKARAMYDGPNRGMPGFF